MALQPCVQTLSQILVKMTLNLNDGTVSGLEIPKDTHLNTVDNSQDKIKHSNKNL